MADATLSAVSNALEQRFRPRLTRQPNRTTVTLNLLRKQARSGKNDAWDAAVGSSTGQVFDDGADVSTYNDDTYVPAIEQWAEYGDAFAVTGRAEDAAAGDDTEIANLFLAKLYDAGTRAAKVINDDLYAGAGTSGPQVLHGLTASSGPLDSTGTYATIARGSYAQWAGNTFANGGVPRAFTMSLLERAFSATYISSGWQPDAVVTTPYIWQKIAESVEPNRRLVQEVTIRGQKLVLDGGWSAVEVNGVPVFRDISVPTGAIVGVRLDEACVDFLPAAPSRVNRGDVIGMVPIAGTPMEQGVNPPEGSSALMASVSKLARTGNKTKYQLIATIALSVEHPNRTFWIQDVSEAA